MAITTVLSCVCGHLRSDHPELNTCDTTECACPGYIELCPVCQHSTEVHDGLGGKCTRIKVKDRMQCGCTAYATPEGS